MPAQNAVAAFVAAPLRAYIQAKKGLKKKSPSHTVCDNKIKYSVLPPFPR